MSLCYTDNEHQSDYKSDPILLAKQLSSMRIHFPRNLNLIHDGRDMNHMRL